MFGPAHPRVLTTAGFVAKLGRHRMRPQFRWSVLLFLLSLVVTVQSLQLLGVPPPWQSVVPLPPNMQSTLKYWGEEYKTYFILRPSMAQIWYACVLALAIGRVRTSQRETRDWPQQPSLTALMHTHRKALAKIRREYSRKSEEELRQTLQEPPGYTDFMKCPRTWKASLQHIWFCFGPQVLFRFSLRPLLMDWQLGCISVGEEGSGSIHVCTRSLTGGMHRNTSENGGGAIPCSAAFVFP